ncbi:hypothetical protein G6F43_010681 [Rhizopus delemar]|nr:hypothetical protein G6F43_010681 [Rhizopus delemar]
MGYECHLSVLKEVEDFYVLETVDAITFPTTYRDIQGNGEEKVAVCAMVWPSKEEDDEEEKDDSEEADAGEEDDSDEDAGEEDLARIRF